jgi:hypothetical protein
MQHLLTLRSETMASYSRRDFLSSSLQLVTAVSVGATSTASIATNASYLAAAEEIWKPGIVRTDGVLDARELVRLATLAASSHNAQPWKFKIDSNTITIFPDFSRRLPSVDPDDSHLSKSLGCAAENLVHAASAQGHQASAAFDAKQDAVVIGLERSRAETPSALFNAITARKCVRLEYDGKPVDGPQRDSIEYAARRFLVS